MTLSASDRMLLLANAVILDLNLNDAQAMEARAAREAFARAETKLAVYGSLGPGRQNEAVMMRIGGVWREAFAIPGVREPKGWGAALGYPGASWALGRGDIAVSLFESENLPAHWAELDAFEGDEYARLYVSLWRDGAAVDVAFTYAIRESSARTINALLAHG